MEVYHRGMVKTIPYRGSLKNAVRPYGKLASETEILRIADPRKPVIRGIFLANRAGMV